jgi:hypothetical protein
MRNGNVKSWGNSPLPWSGYADDLVLFLLTQNGLQKATELLDSVFKRFGLSINELKTETMIINNLNPEPVKTIVTLREAGLNNVDEFKYLGTYIVANQPDTGENEMNHRIQLAYMKFAEMSNLLQNFRINLHTRILFLQSFVRSRLTYACKNWSLTMNQYDRLDYTYRSLLRRMVRNGFKQIDFRYLITNEQLHSICGTKDVSVFVKSQQLNYASHVVRMPIERSLKQLMFNDDKYKKKGRSVKSLLDQVISNQNISIDGFCSLSIRKKSGRSA